MFVSDTQKPFQAPKALEFCDAVRNEFDIPDENIYHVGDELDLYHGSMHKKDPDAPMSPSDEFAAGMKELKRWYRMFPQMKLATSNHGLRWLRKAAEAEIPSQVLRSYRDLIGAPEGWQWKDEWIIKGSKADICMIHGLGYSGRTGHINAALDKGMNTIIGHLHSHAGINFLNTSGRKIWGCNTGCLIDPDAFAFKYGKWNRQKPVLGITVVLDGGLSPHFIPYESFTK